jgi:hypothetical protein
MYCQYTDYGKRNIFIKNAFSRKYNNKIQLRRNWRCQRGNHNPYIEEEQTTQWPKEKVQNDKQRSTKHTHKTKELMCFGWESSS